MINFSEWGHRKQIAEMVVSKFPHLSNMYGNDQHGSTVFSKSDKGKTVRIRDDSVNVDGLPRDAYWGGAEHADCAGKILSVDPKFKGKVRKLMVAKSCIFENPRTTSFAASLLYYYTQMRCSRFVLCPSGMGWDSYRLWESLSLGAIPIVEDSPGWIRVLDDLPVLIVKNFEEVTPQLLEKEYGRITSNVQKYNFKRLTRQWWIDHIRSLLPPGANTTAEGVLF